MTGATALLKGYATQLPLDTFDYKASQSSFPLQSISLADSLARDRGMHKREIITSLCPNRLTMKYRGLWHALKPIQTIQSLPERQRSNIWIDKLMWEWLITPTEVRKLKYTSATAGWIDSRIACNAELRIFNFFGRRFPVESSFLGKIEESA